MHLKKVSYCKVMKVIKKIIKIIGFPFKCLAKGMIYFYKFFISPLLPSCCIYTPSCSTYTLEAVERFGVIKGCYLGFKRIMRCTPKHKACVDRVPEDIKGDYKWLI